MEILICKGKNCLSRGSEYIEKRLRSDVDFLKLEGVSIDSCLCQWRCEEWPVVILDGNPHVFMNGSKASQTLLSRIKQAKANINHKTWE